MYALCEKRVIAALGPKLNVRKESASGTQILFLLRSEILFEIAMNGLVSENYKVIFLIQKLSTMLNYLSVLDSNERGSYFSVHNKMQNLSF